MVQLAVASRLPLKWSIFCLSFSCYSVPSLVGAESYSSVRSSFLLLVLLMEIRDWEAARHWSGLLLLLVWYDPWCRHWLMRQGNSSIWFLSLASLYARTMTTTQPLSVSRTVMSVPSDFISVVVIPLGAHIWCVSQVTIQLHPKKKSLCICFGW